MTYSEPARTAARRKLRPLAALAMVALIGAGCSSGSSDGTGNSGGDTSAANRAQAMKFATCMRENGVKEFPDPDASGRLTLDGILNGSSLDPSTPGWKAALAACKDQQPPGFTGGERSPEEQEAALEFAQCIRDNGVEDFPDPVNGEPLVDTNRIPSAASSSGMTILNAAMRTCGDAFSDELGLGGR